MKSLNKDFIYTGSTKNLVNRLNEHNEGKCLSTKAYRPFELSAYIAIITDSKARELEKYFNSGSGKAILKKEF